MAKKSEHYVNNAEFLEAIKVYRTAFLEAKEQGLEKPAISNYLGECVLKIATHLSYKPNFIGYSYRDDMILDGVENCIQYMGSFDPNKSSNPFSYFTQVIWYAFIRRIGKEKKQANIKCKIIQEIPFDAFDLQEQDEDAHYISSYVEFMQANGKFDDLPEEPKKAAKKIKHVSLDDFI